MGLTLEAAAGPGVTWYWSEHFVAQPETLRYLEHVVEKFDLAKDRQFGCTVKRCLWDEDSRIWTVELADGRSLTCRFLLTAIGLLSAATLPKIERMDSFEGQSFHTYYWPHEQVEVRGKKVAVVGTGATGAHVIAEITDEVDQLTMFQRRPNWCATNKILQHVNDPELAEKLIPTDHGFGVQRVLMATTTRLTTGIT